MLPNCRGTPRGAGIVKLIKFYCLCVERCTVFMRTELDERSKEFFGDLALKLRYGRKITQYRMAEAFVMSEWSEVLA